MRICEVCQARFHSEALRCPLDGGKLVSPPDPLLGRKLAGRYIIQEKVGSGGMGSVYRAHHEVLDRAVAVKFLAPSLSRDSINRTRFLREARAANRINHEHIIDITDFGETDDGQAYMVMEFLDGIALNLELAHGALARVRALRIALQVAQALARAHELGVVHRDIKPENIFLLRGYEQDFVKLLDFGLAKIKGELRVTATGTIFGTPEYIAPEQATGSAVGPATDLYALGVVLFEMLTGKLPFEGTPSELLIHHLETPPSSPSVVDPTLPPAIDSLVLDLLQKDPKRRPGSAYELVQSLKDLIRGIAGSPEELRSPVPKASPTVFPTREHPPVEEIWAHRLDHFRTATQRAHGEVAPPNWLTEALVHIEVHLDEMRKLRRELDARAQQITSQQRAVRDLRLDLGRAIDELAPDIARVEDDVAAATARIEEQRERLASGHGAVWEAWAAIPTVDRAVTGISTDFLSRLAEAGRKAAAHLSEVQAMSQLEQQLRAHRRERDDLTFQVHQLKGRLASLGAERDLEVDELREETERLDRELRSRMNEISAVAEKVTAHLFSANDPSPVIPDAADTLLDWSAKNRTVN